MTQDEAKLVVQDSIGMREKSQAAIPMTIARAIDHAKFLRRIGQEAVLSTEQARQTIDTLLSALELHPSLLKALLNGEEVFVLRQQDRAAPHAIGEWAQLARMHGCPVTKVDEAIAKATAWINQSTDKTKWPD